MPDPTDKPDPPAKPRDPLAEEIRKILHENLRENNANPEAFWRDKFERSKHNPNATPPNSGVEP